MTIDSNQPILVTGASGYIASWIVKYLLDAGHTVHATVRDPSDKAKVGHLERLAAAGSGTLKLFAADLLENGSFDEAMTGCQLVMHTASPFVFKGITDPAEQLVKPAVEGTRNVLEAANRTDSVKRVVLTSSVAAICGDAAEIHSIEGNAFDERHWNTTSRPEGQQAYSYSKLQAEKTAWEIAGAQSRWDLVAVNPAFVMGPSLTQASASTSLSTLRELVDGTLRMGVPAMYFNIVDVREVATTHIRAGFTPEAEGRYITCAGPLTLTGMVQILKRHFGNSYKFPLMQAPKALVWLIAPFLGYSRRFIARNVGHELRFDTRRAREVLDMTYRDPGQTVIDHVQQMIDDGILPAPR